MLKLRNICKSYKYGKNDKEVLRNINIDFNKKELVFILGKSGSGKSTLLNIIGGNLKPTSGNVYFDDVIINKISDVKLNYYRKNSVATVFQDYGLIEYMSVYDNIKLASSSNKEKAKIDELLKQLEIFDKKSMKVAKLSGGEKQRVAIARAMIKDPEIILCDEPTGALDINTSYKIFEILKRISKNKLVIVVTHDRENANKYGDRIIEIKDGNLEYLPQMDCVLFKGINKSVFKKKKIWWFALKNVWIKKRRNFFTSLAISLGIISIMLVLMLASNFNDEIDTLESDMVTYFPIEITNGLYYKDNYNNKVSNNDILVRNREDYIIENKINKDFIEYLDSIDEIYNITYSYNISMPIISDKYKLISDTYLNNIDMDSKQINNYKLLAGKIPDDKNEVLLLVNNDNSIDLEIAKYFDISSDFSYLDILNRKMKVILNDDYYLFDGNAYYKNNNYESMYNNSLLELTIVGVVMEEENISFGCGILYDSNLIDDVLSLNKNSKIVLSQINSDNSILGIDISKEESLSYLGYNTYPDSVKIYVSSLDNKDKVIDKLDNYNNKYYYIDSMSSAIDIVKEFILIISIILISFSIIAVLISSLMIGILTNVRVLERKREIGIFRNLGASKKDVKNLFNIENIIIGILSSLISIIVLFLLVTPVNSLLNKIIGLENIFKINYQIMLLVLLINIFIVKISGSIPSTRASKMEIVKCIYGR